MSFNWQKIFNLVNRTGDKLIVCDSANDSAIVVMDLEKYEKLLARAEWGGAEDEAADFDVMEEELDTMPPQNDAIEDESKPEKESDDLYYLEPVA